MPEAGVHRPPRGCSEHALEDRHLIASPGEGEGRMKGLLSWRQETAFVLGSGTGAGDSSQGMTVGCLPGPQGKRDQGLRPHTVPPRCHLQLFLPWGRCPSVTGSLVPPGVPWGRL